MDRRRGQGEEYLDTLPGDIQWAVQLARTADRFEKHFRDESGDAVRRATENGNGALVGPSLGRRKVFWCVRAGARQPESLCAGGNRDEAWLPERSGKLGGVKLCAGRSRGVLGQASLSGYGVKPVG